MEGKTKLAFSNRLISETFSGKNYVCVEIKFIIYMRFYVIRIRPLVRTEFYSVPVHTHIIKEVGSISIQINKK